MDTWNVALIDQTGVVLDATLQQFAAALQQQTYDDLAPAWNVRADISVLAAGDNIPAGTWPIYIVDSLNGEGGVHLDAQGEVYATVAKDPPDQLSLTISHELLEMLVDPQGDRMMPATDLDQGYPGRQVSYLLEVCDPCEVYSYLINNVPVSDFIFRSFYDSNAAGRVDLLGSLVGPLPQKVPTGCYISWWDPEDQAWYQQQTDGTVVLGAGATSGNPRADRDSAFGRTHPGRHDLPAIYRAWPEAVKCLSKPS